MTIMKRHIAVEFTGHLGTDFLATFTIADDPLGPLHLSRLSKVHRRKG